MPSVNAKQNEHLDSMLRRFKRACEKAGVLTELKRRARYTKPTKIRGQEKAAAAKRWQKKLMKEAPMPSRGIKGRKKKKK
ncbi:MAG: 30S ribosomal protein S21 [Legionellales bacterium]|nr:30S ribosomal protein S21 [Legionellales bacterium]|tara:strand:- start:107 stop:346 length:240 start_codon:yes stop_codon:yes gene_type:complete